jgi:hypothetical protein
VAKSNPARIEQRGGFIAGFGLLRKTVAAFASRFLSSLTGLARVFAGYPALKCWAIIGEGMGHWISRLQFLEWLKVKCNQEDF